MIEYLEELESSLLDETIIKKHKSKDASPKSTSSLKEDKKDMKQVKFGKEAGGGIFRSLMSSVRS